MKIGIIGAGKVGTGLTKHLVPKGHNVMLSFNRDMEKLKKVAAAFGASAGTVHEAAQFGDIVVLATPWSATAEALAKIGKLSKSKILWDCTNSLKPDMSGLLLGTSTSAGEEVAKLAPWANVVKALPPFAEVMHSSSMLIGGARASVFICGDDAQARKVIAELVEDIGAEPINAGPLSLARYAEPAAMLLVQLAYVNDFGTRIGLAFNHGT